MEKERRKREYVLNAKKSASHNISDADLNWSFLNSELRYHAKKSDRVKYRDTRLEMAMQLFSEKKYKNALFAFLEVAYRDLDSPDNLICSWVTDPIYHIIIIQNLDISDVKEIWDTQLVARIRLPLPHDEAWDEISEILGILIKANRR